MPSWFRRYLLPGFVFQSIIIAGGYGTGRELVEFFLRFGPVGGLLAMLIPATLLSSITAALSFELARVTKSYDYRTFFKHLLGPAWWLYEIGYVAAIFLITAVIGSAAGIFVSEAFGLPNAVGAIGLLLAIGLLVFKGTETIEKVLSAWSFLLYAAYVGLFLWSFSHFGTEISTNLGAGEVRSGWWLSGLRYGALQVSLIPAMLFATTHITTRREAYTAGLLAGPIAMIPGVLFLLAIASQYPDVLDRDLPVNHLLELLGSRPFQTVFIVVLFGTLIETGTGLIHAFNERMARVFESRGRVLPTGARPAIATGLLLIGWLMSGIGITRLIGQGYGTMTWFFLAIFVVPLLTVGVKKIRAGAS